LAGEKYVALQKMEEILRQEDETPSDGFKTDDILDNSDNEPFSD